MIYLDGAGCYGMNGHDDAAADAALLSKAVGRPVRVQWSREDELGWDPKGPPQVLELRGALDAPTGASTPGRPRCGCRAPPRSLEWHAAARRRSPPACASRWASRAA